MRELALAVAMAAAAPQTAQQLEQLSWEARRALAARDLDRAEAIAGQTYELCLEALKSRALDADRHLPIALGAAIEVRAQVLAARHRRGEAVAFLQEQLARYRATSIRTRIQKNIHLLSLEGRPAPPLEGVDWVRLKGRPVLLFFWAHWCGDCKARAGILRKLTDTYREKGLVLIAPTQLYGYTARGQEASAAQETRYIQEARARYYPGIEASAVPISSENFRNYGASTTPTFVLVDREGIVRCYHPGNMSYEDLASRVEVLTRSSGS